MDRLWRNTGTGIRGNRLNARSRRWNGARLCSTEAVVPLEVLDQVFDVLIESLWLLRDNRNRYSLLGLRGHPRWVPDSESLSIDHRQSREERKRRGRGARV